MKTLRNSLLVVALMCGGMISAGDVATRQNRMQEVKAKATATIQKAISFVKVNKKAITGTAVTAATIGLVYKNKEALKVVASFIRDLRK